MNPSVTELLLEEYREEIKKLKSQKQALLEAAKNALEAHQREVAYGGLVYTDEKELQTAIALAEGR